MGMAADLAIFLQEITLEMISLSSPKHHNLDLTKRLSAPMAPLTPGKWLASGCPEGGPRWAVNDLDSDGRTCGSTLLFLGRILPRIRQKRATKTKFCGGEGYD